MHLLTPRQSSCHCIAFITHTNRPGQGKSGSSIIDMTDDVTKNSVPVGDMVLPVYYGRPSSATLTLHHHLVLHEY